MYQFMSAAEKQKSVDRSVMRSIPQLIMLISTPLVHLGQQSFVHLSEHDVLLTLPPHIKGFIISLGILHPPSLQCSGAISSIYLLSD